MIQPTNLYIVTRTCIIPFQFLLELTTVESTEQDWPLLNSLHSYPLNVKRTAVVEDFSNGEVAARDAFSRSRIAVFRSPVFPINFVVATMIAIRAKV